jgi:hypothetical protein
MSKISSQLNADQMEGTPHNLSKLCVCTFLFGYLFIGFVVIVFLRHDLTMSFRLALILLPQSPEC